MIGFEKDAGRAELKLKIAREALELAEIPELPSVTEKLEGKRYVISYSEQDDDIVISMRTDSLVTSAIIHFSLGNLVIRILNELESLLEDPKARKIFEIEKNEVEYAVYRRTVRITAEYIRHLPTVLYHSFSQAFTETIISHIKKSVEFEVREYQQSQIIKAKSNINEVNTELLKEIDELKDIIRRVVKSNN